MNRPMDSFTFIPHSRKNGGDVVLKIDDPDPLGSCQLLISYWTVIIDVIIEIIKADFFKTHVDNRN